MAPDVGHQVVCRDRRRDSDCRGCARRWEDSVSDYVPELKQSAFGNATVREVMDMTTGLDYNENYADPESDIWLYAAAGDPTPKPASYKGPLVARDLVLRVLQGVSEARRAPTARRLFISRSIPTLLAWVIARATGKDFIEHLSERIWKPLGMEQEADMMIDSLGTPFSAGGAESVTA